MTDSQPRTTGVEGEPWTRFEVEAVVSDYFHMLVQELAGQAYNKAEHNRRLQEVLGGVRSRGSIEMKHANVTAVLIELGCPYIPGYKPRGNFQSLLYDVVADRVARDQEFNNVAALAVAQPAFPRLWSALDQEMVVAAPRPSGGGRVVSESPKVRRPIQRDYLLREAQNRSLGLAGEELVLGFERNRLRIAGCDRLSERVEHVSKTRGDGLGFDILSFEPDGAERFIEVKTTGFGEMTPFYVSPNEVALSEEVPHQYQVYRLFDFRTQPRMFMLAGRMRDLVTLDPASYLARVK